MATVHDLSVELVELISTHLDPSTFCSFRLASREIYDRTYQDFIRRITSLGFFLAPHSLNVLSDICNHEHLAKRFHTLCIGSHTIDVDGAYWAVQPRDEDEDLRGARAYEKYLGYFEGQEMYLQGDDSVAIAYILAKATSLHSIQVGEWDGVNQWERPKVIYHGRKIFEEETGCTYETGCRPGIDADTGLTHAFKVVLRALATTKTPIKQLAAGVCERDNAPELHTIAIAAMPELTSYLRAGLEISLSTLRVLDLAVGFGEKGDGSLSWLESFINLAVNLQELTLTCEQGHLLGITHLFLDSNRSFIAMNAFLNGANLKRLTKFTLQNAIIGAWPFCDFILRHKNTISEIGIRRVTIHGESWQSVMNEIIDHSLPALCRIEMAWLEEAAVGDVRRALVTFDPKGLSECDKCEDKMLYDIDFKANDCKHTAKTVSREEAQSLIINAVDYHYCQDSYRYFFPDDSDTSDE